MTVADLINRALKVMGVLAAGETCTAAEQSDAFDTLNAMMDGWANQKLALFVTARDSYTLTPNLNPHTIGATGTFVATRPVTISRASIVLSGQANAELPLQLVSDDEWQGLQSKSTSGTPVYLWVQSGYPLTSLWLNPKPASADAIVLYTPTQLGRFAATTTTFAMPPGYEEAVIHNLAKRLCPQYGVQLSAEAAEIAVESLAGLKRTNSKTDYLRSDPAVLASGGFNLISGDR